MLGWLRPRTSRQEPIRTWGDAGAEERAAHVRARGVAIGAGCHIETRPENFSTEPYLIEIGDHVAIGPDVRFATHDGAAWVVRDRRPHLQVFGRIVIGSNSFIGLGSILLAGTTIGRDCVVGAGAVVRGTIPDGSVVLGNPARVVMPTAMLERLWLGSGNALETKDLVGRELEDLLRRHFNLTPTEPIDA